MQTTTYRHPANYLDTAATARISPSGFHAIDSWPTRPALAPHMAELDHFVRRRRRELAALEARIDELKQSVFLG